MPKRPDATPTPIRLCYVCPCDASRDFHLHRHLEPCVGKRCQSDALSPASEGPSCMYAYDRHSLNNPKNTTAQHGDSSSGQSRPGHRPRPPHLRRLFLGCETRRGRGRAPRACTPEECGRPGDPASRSRPLPANATRRRAPESLRPRAGSHCLSLPSRHPPARRSPQISAPQQQPLATGARPPGALSPPPARSPPAAAAAAVSVLT